MRIRLGLAITLATPLVVVASALATNLPAVLYQPPKIVFIDQVEIGSDEDLTISKQGSDFVFANTQGSVKHPNSEPGCTDSFSMSYHCPVAGIKRMTVKLGAMDDDTVIDLGSRADNVEQILRGGSGGDTIGGGPGSQEEYGESGNDTLTGGDGPDLLDGGGGTDDCDGGPGHDVIKRCE